MDDQQLKARCRSAAKTIDRDQKSRIVALPVLSTSEIQAAKTAATQAATEAAVRAVMPHIQAMRAAGASFVKIQRVFAGGRVQISLTELRTIYEKLNAEEHADGHGASPIQGTP